MKKLLILSDTHNNYDMKNLFEQENADLIIHAGDSELNKDNSIFKRIDFYVQGNCDFPIFPETIIKQIDDRTNLFVTHGHLYDVKMYLDKLIYTALEKKSNIIIFGHTHQLYCEYDEENDLLILNPGSTSLPRSDYGPTYIILEQQENKYIINIKSALNFNVIKKFIYERNYNEKH